LLTCSSANYFSFNNSPEMNLAGAVVERKTILMGDTQSTM
jgi:hypothetical protein